MNTTEYFENKITEMANLQDEINSIINPNWKSAGNKWYRAIWIECAELMDHVGWKWWKFQEADISQVKLELVDIWHFALSDMIEKADSIEQHIKEVANNIGHLEIKDDIDEEKILLSVESLSKHALADLGFNSRSFFEAAKASGMTFDELYKTYIGKNILNKFRQLHGYKDGSYQKTWDGKEDNYWLSSLIESTPLNISGFPTHIYNSLEDIYKNIEKV
ncbi:dUTP diphosphatase [Rheinheimera oceanensis]|uniref:dUTP diphosphatase n=1 Tax=Rheinheimera oceanensis TaxID=2817449 RepID=UPI001BFE6692|nr:dUTP diphosphatase [Rheinheimera oceanensis]